MDNYVPSVQEIPCKIHRMMNINELMPLSEFPPFNQPPVKTGATVKPAEAGYEERFGLINLLQQVFRYQTPDSSGGSLKDR
jgi:hypothetical protein